MKFYLNLNDSQFNLWKRPIDLTENDEIKSLLDEMY